MNNILRELRILAGGYIQAAEAACNQPVADSGAHFAVSSNLNVRMLAAAASSDSSNHGIYIGVLQSCFFL